MIIRKRQVELGGLHVTIGELTFEQIERYIEQQPPTDALTLKASNLQLVCESLNNALRSGEPAWTPERVAKEFGWVTLNHLLPEEIMKFNGLEPKATPAA